MSAKPEQHLVLITGGERSGKSRYAQQMALQFTERPIYLATARVWDGDFHKRIQKHQLDRDDRWTSVEEEKYPSRHGLVGKTIVLDCVTLWLSNFFADLKYDVDHCLEACKIEIDHMIQQQAIWIIVSNEIGMGVHAATEQGRKFTELQGWVNQYIAERADQVVLMISGIPVIIKKGSP